MRRLIRPSLFVLLLLCCSLPVIGKDMILQRRLTAKGTDAEARQDYEKAFDYFKQAYNLKPKDLRYRTAFERTRFYAASSHVHRGQVLRDAGKLDEAVVEFQKGLDIDPSSFIAQQELNRTKQMIREVAESAAAAAGPTPLRRRLQSAQGPVELAPISNVPITLKVTEKANVIYETVGKLAGINVLFDPDYVPKQVRIELNGVTLEDALEIISFETKTFWRPVTPNTIFIAQDTPAKRKELEQNVIKTFYLSNLSQPTELQDVVNAMRTILEVSRIQQLPSQGAIVVRGTPDQVALAQKLVDDLDKAKPEVLIDIAVMQVSRDKSHTLGINPPTSASVQLQPNINTSTTTSSTGTTTSPSSIIERHQPEYSRESECYGLPGNDSAGYGDGLDERYRYQGDPESAGARAGRAEGDVEDRRPRAGGDRIVPTRNWRRGHQPAGQHAIPIPRCGREHRNYAARACRTGNFLEVVDGCFGCRFLREHWRHQPAGDRPAQNRKRNPAQRGRSQPARRHDGGLEDQGSDRDPGSG